MLDLGTKVFSTLIIPSPIRARRAILKKFLFGDASEPEIFPTAPSHLHPTNCPWIRPLKIKMGTKKDIESIYRIFRDSRLLGTQKFQSKQLLVLVAKVKIFQARIEQYSIFTRGVSRGSIEVGGKEEGG